MNFYKFITKDGEVLLDLTSQKVSPETLAEGETAVDETGKIITGLMKSGITGGIKDVETLPTENIDSNAIYRITESTNEPAAVYVYIPDISPSPMTFGQLLVSMLVGEGDVEVQLIETFFEVDELPAPEEMEQSILDESTFTITLPTYILKSTGVGYVAQNRDGNIYVMSVGEGFGSAEMDKGYIDNFESITEPGAYAVHGTSYSIYYHWKYIDGTWNKVTAAIDVSELPTENILPDTCYRLTPIGEMNLYIMIEGGLMDYNALAEQYGKAITYIPVDALPETVPEGIDETTVSVVNSTGVPYVAAEGQFFEMGLAMGGLTSYGWIEDPATITADGVYMFSTSSEVEYYTYRNNDWVKFSTGGGSSFDSLIAGVDEETFTFPKGITAIAPYLCYGRNYITVKIPASVKSIGDYAFYNCENLTTIEFNGSATAWGNVKLENNWLSEGAECKTICSDGTIIMPNGVAYTPDSEGAAYTVRGIYNDKTTNVEILSMIDDVPVVAIADNAFKNKNTIVSVSIPENVTSIGESAFYGCSELVSANISEGVTSIGTSAFYGCTKLINVNIPSSLTNISVNTFGRCVNLTNITIPEGVTSISDRAFTHCPNLVSITIPSSVTSINENAFNECYKLIEIQNLSNVTIVIGNGIGYYASNIYTATSGSSKLVTNGDYIFYCDNENDRYWLMAYTGDDTEIVLPNDINGNIYSLHKYAFYSRPVVSVVCPEGSGIHDYAFSYCSKLVSVTLPSTLQLINRGVFSNCINLNKIIIPEGVKSIGAYAFSQCSALTNINIPSAVTSIGDYAFEYCVKLIEIQNLSTLNIIAGSAGYGRIGVYAKNIYTADSGSSKLVTSGDYLFYADNETNENYLVAYTGRASDLILPSDFNGSSYGIGEYAF